MRHLTNTTENEMTILNKKNCSKCINIHSSKYKEDIFSFAWNTVTVLIFTKYDNIQYVFISRSVFYSYESVVQI
jgi:hypothetical protein